MSLVFSSCACKRFKRHLHRAFKMPKPRSTVTLLPERALLNFFCLAVRLAEKLKGRINQLNNGYPPSPITSGLTWLP